ncbi:MAG: RecQ family ATP-dependent DNA helicase [Chitinophagaceae bacterium]|nr:RecQ family ATP-dependent DNA helicase [Chitinophagaceae bacterium]
MTIHDLLKKYWGFSTFRDMQEDIIQSVMDGKDTLALLPTGGGKSVCFQIPALAREGICIVVSPLIALMKDQVANLEQKGIKAIAVYSGMSKQEIDIAIDNCVYGNYKFLYVSPERLATDILKVRVAKMKVNLLAIDEAHCISQWGYDFRPPYLRIAEFRAIIPEVPVLALTATATPPVVLDICDKLQFKNKNVFQKSFERDNLSYSVLFEESKNERLAKMLNKVPGTAIAYVRNRRKTKEIADYLKKKNISADYYHAGLDHATRSKKQEAWTKNKTRVMVSTNAFGMGIDKPDVRLVVHMDVPDDMESYFQEAGRGGRDGKKSFAVLLYNNSDVADLTERLEHFIPAVEKIRQTYQALANHFQLAIGAGENQSFDFDIAFFSKKYRFNPVETLQALKTLEQEGYIALTEAVFIRSRILLKVNKEVLYRFEVENKKHETLLRTLLRSYSGIFEDFVPINENDLARFTGLSREQVVVQLKELEQFNLLKYEPQKDVPQVIFLQPRADSDRMPFDYELLKRRKLAHELRLTAMKNYLLTINSCRSQMLLAYFGEKDAPRCGICDLCLRRNRLDLSDLEFEQITLQVKNLLQIKPQTITEVVNKIPKMHEKKMLETIQWLLDNEELQLNDQHQLIFRV